MADRLQYQINTMKAWVKRRADAHKNWTSDQLWERIKHNWPALCEGDMEIIFQGSVSWV